MAAVQPSQSKAEGFVAHYAVVEDGGFTVAEIWDSADQHDACFNAALKPLLPPGTPERTFAEARHSNTRS